MKLMRNNRTKSDCGIVAAFNAAAWCNLSLPYKKVEKLARSCGYSYSKGMYVFQFSKLLKDLSVPFKKVRPKSAKEIEDKVEKGYFFAIVYGFHGNVTGHVVTVFSDHNGNIKVLNPDSERGTWRKLMNDIKANGVKTFHVYQMPKIKD